MVGECRLALRGARRVQCFILVCSAREVLSYTCSSDLHSTYSASAVLRMARSARAVCVRRARPMLSCVAAGSAGVTDKVVAASKGGWRRKLAYMVQRLFAAGASHHLTSANR